LHMRSIQSCVALLAAAFAACGCAAAFTELPAERREETCAFLSHRARQGDFVACALAAQRVAVKQAGFSDLVGPRFQVTAEVVYGEDGAPVRVARLDSNVPGQDRDSVTECYRSALLSSAVPPTGTKVRVPIRFRFDALGTVPPAAGPERAVLPVDAGFAGCVVDVLEEGP